jgi:hypothetical protein
MAASSALRLAAYLAERLVEKRAGLTVALMAPQKVDSKAGKTADRMAATSG